MFYFLLDAPYQKSSTICRWMTNEMENCFIEFLSNPASNPIMITKKGKN